MLLIAPEGIEIFNEVTGKDGDDSLNRTRRN